MSLRDNWKSTGKNLGSAFKQVGKNVARSAKNGLDVIAEDKTKGDSTVFNDGSWRKTGKDLGNAFTGLGKSIVKSAKTGLDHINTDDHNEPPAIENNQTDSQIENE